MHSVQAQLYGPGPRTSDNVDALEIVTYDGERFWVGTGEEQQLDQIIAAGGRKTPQGFDLSNRVHPACLR